MIDFDFDFDLDFDASLKCPLAPLPFSTRPRHVNIPLPHHYE